MYPAQVDVGIAPYEHGSRLRAGQKTKWVTHATNQKLRGDAGLRYPH